MPTMQMIDLRCALRTIAARRDGVAGLALATLMLVALGSAAGAQEKSPKADDKVPAPLTHYKGREIAVTMHFTGAPWLVRDEREREERASEMIAALGVKEGQ